MQTPKFYTTNIEKTIMWGYDFGETNKFHTRHRATPPPTSYSKKRPLPPPPSHHEFAQIFEVENVFILLSFFRWWEVWIKVKEMYNCGLT